MKSLTRLLKSCKSKSKFVKSHGRFGPKRAGNVANERWQASYGNVRPFINEIEIIVFHKIIKLTV